VRQRLAFYDFSEKKLRFEPVFLIGACRSGKSSLGRLLGSLPHHFHVEEDWHLLMLPLLCRYKLMKESVFVNYFRAALSEMIYDVILMRRVSFRPSDHSFVKRMKSDAEIRHSLEILKSRSDVENYLAKNHVVLIFNLAELGGFVDLLKKVYPSTRLVLVERESSALAEDIKKKAWYDDKNLKKPGNRQLFRIFKNGRDTLYLPFWVAPPDSKRFLKMNSLERARYYAASQENLTRQALKRGGPMKLTRVRYEDLLKNPEAVLKRLAPGEAWGKKTHELLKELRNR
jgi:hypothetical protein